MRCHNVLNDVGCLRYHFRLMWQYHPSPTLPYIALDRDDYQSSFENCATGSLLPVIRAGKKRIAAKFPVQNSSSASSSPLTGSLLVSEKTFVEFDPFVSGGVGRGRGGGAFVDI